MRLRLIYLLAAVCLLLLVATPSAYAADVTVDCNNPKKNNSINAALATLNKHGPNTIHVSGTCNENVIIEGFYQLTLVANPGATINDPTPSDPANDDVIDIYDSHIVTVNGFTINGGSGGIACFAYSSCVLLNNTVQGAADFAVIIGRQSAAELQGGTLQNSGTGLAVIHGAEVVVFGTTIQNNQDVGVWVFVHSFFRMSNGGIGTNTIRNNQNAGVRAETNSTVYANANAMNITANPVGIALAEASVARLDWANITNTNSITDNGKGVDVGDSSFARVENVSMLRNSGGNVLCSGQFSNATGKFPCHAP